MIVRRKTRLKSTEATSPLSWLFAGFSTSAIFLCSLFILFGFAGSAIFNTLINDTKTAQLGQSARVLALLPVVIQTATAFPTSNQINTPAETPTPTLPPLSSPTPTATMIASLATSTPTPHPMEAYTINQLRQRAYLGGNLEILETLTVNNHFTRFYIAYPSDHLTITGIMQVPQGDGPFPVIILNHGYIEPDRYWSGSGTWNAASYLNQAGYLTIAPDYRSWGESGTDNSFFSTGQLIDTLNLVGSLKSVSYADTERVGMWGHSMGGGITLKAITIDPRIKAAILYAPVSGNDAEWINRWGPGCSEGQPYQIGHDCGGAEILVDDIDPDLFSAYADAIRNPAILTQTSAINFLEHVIVPIQIHIGTADTRTPPQWSHTINQRLIDANKEAEFFIYPNQGHALKDEGWQLFMERVIDFFDRHVLDAYGLG